MIYISSNLLAVLVVSSVKVVDLSIFLSTIKLGHYQRYPDGYNFIQIAGENCVTVQKDHF